jgi:O-antigen ligase
MNQLISTFVLVGGTVLAVLAAYVGMVSTSQITSRRGYGYLHWMFYAMLLMVALPNLLSGRDMTTTAASMAEQLVQVRHPLVAILQPVVSMLILAVAGERILSRWLRPAEGTPVPVLTLTVFIVFWAGTVLSPALFGARPHLSHDYFYPVVIGTAVLLSSGIERDLAFRAARNALYLFMVASILMIPIAPRMVLDTAYTQGLIPGLPRLAGLSPHPVSLGVLSQLALLCLLACPYHNKWLNRMAWLLGLGVLFMAQSKTSWIAFILCSACIVLTRKAPGFIRRAGDPIRNEVGIIVLLFFMLTVVAAAGLFMFGDVGGKLSAFFASSEGAQLTSLTGRDKIWAIAYDEWQRNPVFGYGPTIWDVDYRLLIGMPNATHAHNQFMDSLSRSGTVGAVALSLYALVLLVLSVRYARLSGGLSLALFLALFLRSVSEVPLILMGYGPEFYAQMLLLMTLAAAANQRAAAKVAPREAATTQPIKYARVPLGTRASQ